MQTPTSAAAAWLLEHFKALRRGSDARSHWRDRRSPPPSRHSIAAAALMLAVASCAGPSGQAREGEPAGSTAGQSSAAAAATTEAPRQSQGQAPETNGVVASDHTTFDTLGGAYPQFMWMFNVYTAPCEVEVAPNGQVRPSTAVKANRVGVVDARGVDALFRSIATLAECRLISVPVLMAAPGQEATVESGSVDKAGQPLAGRSISVRATEEAGGLRTRLEASAASGAFSVSSTAGRELVPAGGALVMVVPAPREGEPCTLVVARPSILRSVKDYPFQTSTSLR